MPDPRLKSWLQETFATQLQLGYRWFSEQHRKKHEGIKPDPDGHWVGLYEDNGSCVDIFNDIHPDDQSTVQIISVCIPPSMAAAANTNQCAGRSNH
jgi:hypothetical protein